MGLCGEQPVHYLLCSAELGHDGARKMGPEQKHGL